MKKPLFDIKNKVVVVTGGFGILGHEFAKALIDQGAKVAIFDNRKVSENCEEQWFRKAVVEKNLECFEVDVARRISIERAMKLLCRRWAVPEGLINCAVIDSPPSSSANENGPFENFSKRLLDKMLEVNIKGNI